MVKSPKQRREIRIYVEGGSSDSKVNSEFRRGWQVFLRDLVSEAEKRQMKLSVIASRGRGDAFNDFCNALKDHPEAFNVLLVDSEGFVGEETTPWGYLQQQNNKWAFPKNVSDDQCFLMVQAMEAWIIADPETLKNYYGQHFQANALPKQPENKFTKELLDALKKASEHTSKREYHKMRHAPELLAKVDVAKVRAAAPHCDRLFTVLTKKIRAL